MCAIRLERLVRLQHAIPPLAADPDGDATEVAALKRAAAADRAS